MIIVLLIIATFVFAGTMIFSPGGLGRTITVIISGLIIAISLAALMLNNNYHWGLHQVTTTRSQSLVPLKSPEAALGLKKLGTGSEHVIVYRVAGKSTSVHTVAATTTKTKLTTGTPARVQIKTTRWRFQNHFTKLMFSLGNRSLPVVQRQYRFTIPKTWHVVTVK
ncbi:DUF4811 domain-containing protein [Lactiplantibacillus herbarum]|uniref:DUF4811 domain-containing protein n=1 Tax=Lactiplantibacillus herbarum TaxID=1670446 RepID=UPI00064F9D6D|nr:DUF4811 domain-containing protein [Lactiplantibacillus herbarum]